MRSRTTCDSGRKYTSDRTATMHPLEERETEATFGSGRYPRNLVTKDVQSSTSVKNRNNGKGKSKPSMLACNNGEY